MPQWVQQGFEEYAKRMPHECRLVLKPIDLVKRTKNCDIDRLIKQEGQRMMQAMPPLSHVVAMDPSGKSWTSQDLASELSRWMAEFKHVSLLIGGPEGMDQQCRSSADECWSLSKLTFPHALVRIIVAEQLYRAWSLNLGHPYHK